MKKIFAAMMMTAAISASFSVMAEGDVSLGAYGGTTGLGLGLGYNMSESLKLRTIASRLDLNYESEVDDFDYDLNLELNSAELLADWHPFRNGFRLTAGVMVNSNDFSGDAQPNNPSVVEFGGRSFSTDDIENVSAEIEYNKVAPYLGLGYGRHLGSSNFMVNLDAGVYYLGSPEAKVRATAAAGSDPAIQALLDDAAAREQKDVQDDADKLRFYPQIRIGLAYAF